jgi:putative addiction module killer protein
VSRSGWIGSLPAIRDDVRPVGDGISEMRIDYGPGYRVYFQKRGDTLVVLLCGGDKST